MLTKKQHQLLTFLGEQLQTNGIAPSFDEMKEALSLKSKSGIHRLITALEERGFIRRLPHRARAIEILKMPGASVPGTVRASTVGRPDGFVPNVIEGHFNSSVGGRGREAAANGAEIHSLPLHGRIAAGTPIEALQDDTTFIDVPGSMLGTGEHYALEVEGDSMIDAGIHDGDTAIIRRCDTAENGDIVVALVDDTEATLKQLRRKGNTVALEPANPAYETRIFGPDRVKIQGKLVSLLRRY